MKLKNKTKESIAWISIALFTIAFAGSLWTGWSKTESVYVYANEEGETSTQATVEVEPSAELVELEEDEEYDPSEADVLVGKYADKFGKTTGEKSRLRGVLHCLLNIESVHGNNDGHGDNGMAGGPLQFWEETYIGYRKLMIKEGLVTEIGSRYNLENAIETTAWALVSGRGKAWGPILRWENGVRQGMECPNI